MTRYTAWRSTALNACSLTAASLGGTIVDVSRDDVLITATELSRRLDAGEPTSILDVRWQLTEPDGRPAYERGHLPGAVYVSLEDELSDHDVPGRGRHPLPSGPSIEAAARRQIAHGRYERSMLFGDGFAGKRIADVLASAEISIQKRLAYA